MAKAEMKTESGQTNQQQSTHQTGKQTGQHSGTMQTTGSNTQKLEMARRGTNFPTVFSLGPREIFTLSPFELMRQFSEEMNRAFDNFGLSRQTDGMQRTAWSPAIDIFKKDGNLIVHAELPGLNKDEVKIEATEDGLVIRGEKKSEHEEHGEGFYRCERSHGEFYRLIPLPENAGLDDVHAQFNNGVLEISIPLPEPQRTKREIQIEANTNQQT